MKIIRKLIDIIGLKNVAGTQINPATEDTLLFIKSSSSSCSLSLFSSGFMLNDVDESGDPKYYGYTNLDEEWYILQVTGDTQYRYAGGTTDYPTNWTGRAGLSYDYWGA